jgi:hypothetical protein
MELEESWVVVTVDWNAISACVSTRLLCQYALPPTSNSTQIPKNVSRSIRKIHRRNLHASRHVTNVIPLNAPR